MKISICGKGGSGKSTIVTLLARELQKRNREILIVDADESNYGLHRHLGMEKPEDFMEYVGGKDGYAKNRGTDAQAFLNRYFKGIWTLSDIPSQYYTEKNRIKLMCSGKIQVSGEGCACPFHAVLKNFISHLELSDSQDALFDMEAGIEHFGRGIDEKMDLILMVCDPSFESIQLAGKITKMAETIEKPVYYILNKVDNVSEKIVKEAIGKQENVVGVIPANPELLAEGLSGKEITVTISEISKVADLVTK